MGVKQRQFLILFIKINDTNLLTIHPNYFKASVFTFMFTNNPETPVNPNRYKYNIKSHCYPI